MAIAVPTNEPFELARGDRWHWRREDLSVDHPASTWTLNYHFKNAANEFNILATADGDAFVVDRTPAESAVYVEGDYEWTAYVTLGTSDRRKVDAGQLKVLLDLSIAGTADLRSYARICLANIEAVIKGRATKDQDSYSIAGRSLGRTPIDDLLTLRDRFRREVAEEIRAANIAAGKASGSTIKVEFK